MIAKDIISECIPPLKTSDTGSQALKWMNELRVLHLPIVNNRQFLGLISEEDIIDLSQPDEPIGNHTLSLTKPFVNYNRHIYDVIKAVADLNLSIIPVLDEDEKYLGVITLEDLVKNLASISSVQEPGGIIVLEVAEHDYQLSEIARIVESNSALILSSYITSGKESSKVEVTLKMNQVDLKHIVATFERFDYKIIDTFQVSDTFDTLKERYDSLMKYLDI